LSKYLKCKVWRLAVRYVKYIYIYIYIYVVSRLRVKMLPVTVSNIDLFVFAEIYLPQSR
jgi:hypothetical protein